MYAQQGQELQKVRLQLFWKHQFEFAGFYAAIEQGYYHEAGIELEFVPYDPERDHIESVLAGKADIGLSGIGVVEQFHKDKPLILLSSYFKRSPLVLITQPEIKSLSALVGESVQGRESLLKTGNIHEMLALHNVDSNNIKAVPYDDPLNALKNKQIKAVIAYVTDLPWELNQLNIQYNIYDPNQYGIVTQDMNLFTTSELAEKEPELLKRFVVATNQGWKYALQNKRKIVDLIKQDYNEQQKAKAALLYEADATEQLILPELYDIGEILPNKLQLISHRLLVSKQIEKLRDLDGFTFSTIGEKNDFEDLLSGEELAYLRKSDYFTVQSEQDFPPFNYQVKGKPVGYSIDYVEMLSSIIGKEIKLVSDKVWAEYLTMLEQQEIDLMINIIKTTDRERFASFTDPFVYLKNTVVTRKQANLAKVSLQDLKKGKVAVIKGYANGELLQTKYGIENVVEVDNIMDALDTILRKDADFFISNGVVANYYIENHFLSGLTLSTFSKDFMYPEIELRIATHKNSLLLHRIVQKAMQQISEADLISLRRKWFTQQTSGQTLAFNQDELNYIEAYEPILCRLNISEGNDRSMTLLQEITKGTGLVIQPSRLYSWQSAIAAFDDGECDLLPNVTATEQRKKKWLFTEPYAVVQQSLVTKKEISDINDLSEWLNKTFVVIKGDALADKLKHYYPHIKLMFVDFPIDAAQAVSQGRAFGYIGSYNTQSSMLVNYAFKNLRLNSVLDSTFSDAQSLAISKSNPTLVGILNKALSQTDKLKLNQLIRGNSVKAGIDALLTEDETNLMLTRELVYCNSSGAVEWEEFIDLITANSPLKVEKSKPMNWHDAIEALAAGDCDFLPEMTETEQRRKRFAFTPPFHQESTVITTLNKQPFISTVETYLDRNFVIEKGNVLKELLTQEYPSMRLTEVDLSIQALDMVKDGKAFAFVGNISTVASTIQEYAVDDIKIAGTLPDRFDDHWSIATRKDDLLVNSILTKVIQAQEKQALQRILSNHTVVNYQSDFNYELVWKITVTAILIVAIFIFWNRRLALLNQQLSLAKQETEEAQKLVVIQEKLSSLGTLTAGVAHEINNPVNFMHASVFMMEEEIERIKAFLRELAGGDNAEPEVIESFEKEFKKLSELAKTAMQGSNRVKTIVNDLRMFSRLEDEKQESTKLAALILSTVHLVRTQYDDIEFEVDCPFDPSLTCYPAKLSQVFMNVIVNACQAIEARIEREPELKGKIYVSMTEVDKHVIVSFEDNGSGMDDKTMQQIFDPFYTTKDVGKGTGLGMSISFGIIEEHQGKINISSKVNAGTVIEVHLPVL